MLTASLSSSSFSQGIQLIADRHRAVHMCVGRGFTSMESEDVGDIDGAVAARFESACENRPRELAT